VAPFEAHDVDTGQCLAIGAQGRVVGMDGDGNLFVIGADGSRSTLAKPDEGRATALGLGANEVVGFVESSTGRIAATYVGNAWQRMETPDGKWSIAAAIDDKGLIVGTTGDMSKGTVQAVRWKDHVLSTLPLGGKHGSAFLAAKGRVAGIVEAGQGKTHAFLLAGDTLEDLGTLGGASSNPFALGEDGTVVGASQVDGGAVHAFVRRPGQPMRDLGLPEGARASEARGIDSSGRIVGNLVGQDGVARAVAFDPNTGRISIMPLPADATGLSYQNARLVGVTSDGRALGVGIAGGEDASVRCLTWSPQ
jgi:probable HAF family extracellular repeat protein